MKGAFPTGEAADADVQCTCVLRLGGWASAYILESDSLPSALE